MNEYQILKNFSDSKSFVQLKKRVGEIREKEKEFDLLSVFEGITKETACSQLFAYLIDSGNPHQLGTKVFEGILQGDGFEELKKFLVTKKYSIECKTEFFSKIKDEEDNITKRLRKDILIRVKENGCDIVVIAIENKVRSYERSNQIKDYQQSLNEKFPQAKKHIIFLTPEGRKPYSHEESISCPCTAMSYSEMIKIIENILPETIGQANVFLKVLATHFSKITNKSTMDREAKNLISEILSDDDSIQAIALINTYNPDYKELFDQLYQKLSQNKNFPLKTFDIDYYIEKKENIEFKIYSNFSEPHDLDFCIMLRSNNKRPSKGDSFKFIFAIWIEDKDPIQTESKEIKKLRNLFTIPSNFVVEKDWSKWICLYTGATYILQDMGTKDIEGLNNLLLSELEKIYPFIKNSLKKYQKG